MKRNILALLAAAALLTGCGDDISSQETGKTAESSSAAQTTADKESSSATETEQPQSYEYTDTKVDPFEVEKQKEQNSDELVQDYETFTNCQDIGKSVWGAYYESRYGADKSRLIPKCPEGVSDMGGAANLTSINCGMVKGDINSPDTNRTFSVVIMLDNRYDSLQSLYDKVSADTTDLTRDWIDITDSAVIEHFTESIYFEYTVDVLTPDGFRAEISSITKDTTLDELTAFAQSLTF